MTTFRAHRSLLVVVFFFSGCTIGSHSIVQDKEFPEMGHIVEKKCSFSKNLQTGEAPVNTPLFPITADLFRDHGIASLVMSPISGYIDILMSPISIYQFYFTRECSTREYERRMENYPVLSAIDKSSGRPGATVLLTGSDLDKNPVVILGDRRAKVLKISNNVVVAAIPGIKPGATSVHVKTSRGKTRRLAFTVVPAKPPLLTVKDIGFKDETGENVIRSGKSGSLSFVVANASGAGEGMGLKVVTDINDGTDLSFPREIEVGEVDGGNEKTVNIPIKAGAYLVDKIVVFKIKVTESNDFAPNPFEVKLRVKKLEPPDLELAKIEVDDSFYPDKPDKLSVGNGNSIAEPGESVEISATLLNKGTGITKDTKVKVRSDSPDITFLGPTEFASGDIHPGNWHDLKIAFSIKKGYKDADDLPITIVISDERERFNKELPLNIKLKRSYPKTELVDIKGSEIPQKEVIMPSFGNELLNIPTAKTDNADAVAVVIGVQNYKNKDVPSVEYALNDAQLFKDYLRTALGYREANIIYLENPTKADFEKVFGTSDNHVGQLSDYIKKGKSDVFVYYTGHGVPDSQTKQPYLVPSDADPNYIKLGGYPLNVLYNNLSLLPARHISVVLDACFSGQSDKGMIIRKASPLMISPVLPGSGNIDLFSSSKADEISSWYPEKRHSLFTYFFLKGLQGEANKNKDRVVTTTELSEYLLENVPYIARRLYGRKQTPAFAGQEEKVLASY